MRSRMADVAVFTIGCKVNQAESEELRAGLLRAGHGIVCDPSRADLCVVNTCSVTAESDRKCRKLVRLLARRGAAAIVVAGCYAEVSPEDLARLPVVVRVLPNARKDAWLDEITSLLPAGGGGPSRAAPGRVRAMIKVQDGCERACSYCIVPRARGRERSRAPGEISQEVARARERQVREIVLCGINLGRYSRGQGMGLDWLVRELLRVGDDFRIRLSSIELEDLRMRWLEEWAACGRVCPHLHLPLQSGDGEILRDMGRGYVRGDFLEAARFLREVWPHAALTTEVMVGYPGESASAFRRTLEVLEASRPARVHVFRFSARPGTRAWGRSDTVDGAESGRRSAMVRELAEELRLRYIEERRGEKRGLLVEKLVERNGAVMALGTTEDFIKGTVTGPPAGTETGDIMDAEILGVIGGRARLRPIEDQGRVTQVTGEKGGK